MVCLPQLEEEDREVPADIRTMREMVKMGSSLDSMIQLTGDCPSSNENGKMPLLDTQVWVEGNKVQYEHYRKPVSNQLLMLEMSAMPAGMKRTVLTQEVVRVRKNTRVGLPWETTVKHLNDLSMRLKMSGYDEAYRYQVIKSGVEGFNKMLQEEEKGGRPIHRPRTWDEDLRQKNKYFQKKHWFSKGGFDVPLLSLTPPWGSWPEG